MNKKENPGVSRRGAAMLLLFSLAVSVLLGFAMPVHAADGGRTTLRTLRVGFYPYTGYMATAADGSRSGYAYELLQDIAQHENVTFAYSCLDGNTQQAMQQLAAGQIDLIPVLRRTAERDEQFAFSAEPIGTVSTMLTVKAGNRSIVAGDYDTFDGITVGMSRSGNGRNESLKPTPRSTVSATPRCTMTPTRSCPVHCATGRSPPQPPTGCARRRTNGSLTPSTSKAFT